MNYIDDPVYQAVQTIRTSSTVEEFMVRNFHDESSKSPQAVRLKSKLTNYKPFERARIIAEATVFPSEIAKPVKLNVFFHIFASPDRARVEVETGQKGDPFPCLGKPVRCVPEWQAAVWTLPNAPNLRELAQLLNPETFCQLLVPATEFQPQRDNFPQPKLIRYVPLKRAILTWEHPLTRRRYFAKLCDRADFRRVTSNFQQIAEIGARGQLGFAVPQVVSENPKCLTFLMSEVAGHPFTEVMLGAFPVPFAELGRVLARLHSCHLSPKTVWTAKKELAVLHRHLNGAKLALPELSRQLDSAIAELRSSSEWLPFSRKVPIHGNLFGDQILYSSDGIGIVDWDSLSLGDPLYDVGRLIAHHIYLAGIDGIAPTQVRGCAEALVGAYEAETGQLVERRRLAWHIASQLLLRGKISSLRKLPNHWQESLTFAVAESERILNGESQYISLPAIAAQVFSRI